MYKHSRTKGTALCMKYQEKLANEREMSGILDSGTAREERAR